MRLLNIFGHCGYHRHMHVFLKGNISAPETYSAPVFSPSLGLQSSESQHAGLATSADRPFLLLELFS